MPYVIAVLMLVVVSVGFTLFQSQDKVAQDATAPTSIEAIKETVNSLIATATPSLPEIYDIPTQEAVPEDTSQPQEIPKQTPETSTTPTPKPEPTPTPAPAPVTTGDYRNGTYSTATSYRTPDGTYQMNVSLTVANDEITSTNLSFDSKGARDGYSKRFSSSYQSQLIGQDLGSVSLSRVGGASLTTKAFNTAINSIRNQAAS